MADVIPFPTERVRTPAQKKKKRRKRGGADVDLRLLVASCMTYYEYPSFRLWEADSDELDGIFVALVPDEEWSIPLQCGWRERVYDAGIAACDGCLLVGVVPDSDHVFAVFEGGDGIIEVREAALRRSDPGGEPVLHWVPRAHGAAL